MVNIYETMKAARQLAVNSLNSVEIENNAKTVVLGNRIQGYKDHQICLSIEGYNRPARQTNAMEISFNCYAATMQLSCQMAESIIDLVSSDHYYIYPEPTVPEEPTPELLSCEFAAGQELQTNTTFEVGADAFVLDVNSDPVYLIDGDYTLTDGTTFSIVNKLISVWEAGESGAGDLVSATFASGQIIETADEEIVVGSVVFVTSNEETLQLLSGDYLTFYERPFSIEASAVTEWGEITMTIPDEEATRYTVNFVDMYQEAPDSDFFKTSVSLKFTYK